MNASAHGRIDRETLTLLERLESIPHEAEQKRAIERLADRGDSDSCRVLISAFYRSMWRTTRLEIIRSLGRFDQQRSVEFLLRQASHPQDLALAAEAVLALGRSNSPAAGEFLLTIVEQPLHPLRREAVLALSNMRHFPCDRELAATLEDYDGDLSPGILQYLILSVGRRGQVSAWPALRRLLTSTETTSGVIFNAVLLATGQIGAEEALADLHALNLPYRFFADELRLAAIERIQHRLQTTVAEVVLHLLATPSELERWPLLFQLRLFPGMTRGRRSNNWPTAAIPRCSVSCVERSSMRRAWTTTLIFSFVMPTSWTRMPRPRWCRCTWDLEMPRSARRCTRACRKPIALTWMERVRDGQAVARLGSWLTEGDAAERVQVVNALVAQAQMAGRESLTAQACGEWLFA